MQICLRLMTYVCVHHACHFLGDSQYSPTVDFRIKVSTVKIGFEKMLHRRFLAIQHDSKPISAELITELKILCSKVRKIRYVYPILSPILEHLFMFAL